jgi:GNAT superfamily N-acetyltransferase
MIVVRPATQADVPEMSRVLIASITELCGPDHGGAPERLAIWTANKTPEGVAGMLANPQLRMLVAELDDRVAAVGAVMPGRGEVSLNYVDPAVRFRGVSKALLSALEAELKGAGVVDAQLTSTTTARSFYHAAGWSEDAAPVACMGGEGHRMRKRL